MKNLPPDLKNRFKSFVASHGGLYFKDHDWRNLEDGITARMHSCGFDSPISYYNYLTTSEEKEVEFRELLNLITINHTYFFRDEAQFKALKDKVIPEIISNAITSYQSALTDNKTPNIRIWSAGCSSGEEPYSIAIILSELIPDLENWDIQIIATDVSGASLDKARRGIYGASSMKYVDSYYKEKYFIEKEEGRLFEVTDQIKKMVHFDYFNLLNENYPTGFSIVFCRNVMIYFELETTIKVIDMISHSLDDNGYLFVGYSESLQFISDEFKMHNWQDAIFYRKKMHESIMPSRKNIQPPPLDLDKLLEEVSQAEVVAEERQNEIVRQETKRKDIEEIIIKVRKRIYLKEYSTAMMLIEKGRSIDKDALELYYLAAEVLANQGMFEDARVELSKAISLNKMFAPTYCLLGSIYIEENVPDKAREYLRKALYLDKDYIVAYLNLANLYKNYGKVKEAIKEYRNALNVLVKKTSNDIIAYSGGFNAATLISVCKDNIERLKNDL